jgi:TPP-dependent pyruvate/acetoin dehydrogenase alpha subunit
MTNKGRSHGVPAASETSPASHGFSLISSEKLIELYATMIKCRMIDDRILILLDKYNLSGTYEAVAGREAAAVGVAIDLRPEDAVSPSQHDLTVSFIKGVPLETIFRQIFARTGNSDPATPDNVGCTGMCLGYEPLNVMAPPRTVAAQFGIATGVTLAGKLQREGKIAVAFLAELSASLDLCDAAFHYASENRLPIVYVCQNGRGDEEIGLKARAHGVPAIPVDRNDVVAIYRVASEAFAHARKGNGPTLIECKPFCLDSKAEIGTNMDIGTQVVEPCNAGDPILNMEKYLIGRGLFSPRLKLDIAADFSNELDAAIAAACIPFGV